MDGTLFFFLYQILLYTLWNAIFFIYKYMYVIQGMFRGVFKILCWGTRRVQRPQSPRFNGRKIQDPTINCFQIYHQKPMTTKNFYPHKNVNPPEKITNHTPAQSYRLYLCMAKIYIFGKAIIVGKSIWHTRFYCTTFNYMLSLLLMLLLLFLLVSIIFFMTDQNHFDKQKLFKLWP